MIDFDLGILRIFDCNLSTEWEWLVVFRCGCNMLTRYNSRPPKVSLLTDCSKQHDREPVLRKLDPLPPLHYPDHMDKWDR